MVQAQDDKISVSDRLPIGKSYTEYTLQDLINDHGYDLLTVYADTRSLLSGLALPASQRDKVVVIGINGPTCAGKTTFTNLLSEKLTSQGIPVSRIGFDWFLYDRAKRNRLVEDIASESVGIPDVTMIAWDVSRYMAILKELKSLDAQNGQKYLLIDGLYDRTTGTQTATEKIPIPYGGYVIVEGVGILDVDRVDLIDYCIRLDVNDDEILIRRAIAREALKPAEKQLTEEFLRHRFDVMDLHHMRYTRKVSHNRNRHIIDASDFSNLKVYSKTYA